VAVKEPSALFAVRPGETAIPAPLVGTVVAPALKLALGPEAGKVNVTCAFCTGFPPASLTVACSRLAKDAPSAADCPPPPVAVMLNGVRNCW